jgi:hypothetical protein
MSTGFNALPRTIEGTVEQLLPDTKDSAAMRTHELSVEVNVIVSRTYSEFGLPTLWGDE